jgi:hypothetical protein
LMHLAAGMPSGQAGWICREFRSSPRATSPTSVRLRATCIRATRRPQRREGRHRARGSSRRRARQHSR